MRGSSKALMYGTGLPVLQAFCLAATYTRTPSQTTGNAGQSPNTLQSSPSSPDVLGREN